MDENENAQAKRGAWEAELRENRELLVHAQRQQIIRLQTFAEMIRIRTEKGELEIDKGTRLLLELERVLATALAAPQIEVPLPRFVIEDIVEQGKRSDELAPPDLQGRPL